MIECCPSKKENKGSLTLRDIPLFLKCLFHNFAWSLCLKSHHHTCIKIKITNAKNKILDWYTKRAPTFGANICLFNTRNSFLAQWRHMAGSCFDNKSLCHLAGHLQPVAIPRDLWEHLRRCSPTNIFVVLHHLKRPYAYHRNLLPRPTACHTLRHCDQAGVKYNRCGSGAQSLLYNTLPLFFSTRFPSILSPLFQFCSDAPHVLASDSDLHDVIGLCLPAAL